MSDPGDNEDLSGYASSNPMGRLAFGERREVTALFYDLVGSTELLTHTDLEDFETLISAFQKRVVRIVRTYGGSISDTQGDGGLALFGYPIPSEDSATTAIHAGLEIVQACKRLAAETGLAELHVRVGISTSEVVVQDLTADAEPKVTGLAPALAARLQQLAPADTVVVTRRTQELARADFVFQFLGPRTIKGFGEEQEVWAVKRRIIGATRFPTSGKFGMLMVNREAELQLAHDLWQQAQAGAGRVLIISGDAGIGKSRLLYDVLRNVHAENTRTVVLQCFPRGTETALSPLIELVRAAAIPPDESGELTYQRLAALLRREGLSDENAIAAIAFAVGVDAPSRFLVGSEKPEQIRDRIYEAVVRFLENWLRSAALIVAVEDLQWIDPTSSQLLCSLIDWARDKPVFIILTTREQLKLKSTGPHVREARLDPLPENLAAELVTNLWPEIDVSTLPPETLSLIYQRASGVPLFLEELAQWVEDKAGSDVGDLLKMLSNTRILSFQNVLSARLGSLGPAKAVAQAAAVIGIRFDEQTLSVMLPDLERDRLSSYLADLVNANILVRADRAMPQNYLFRHSLIQETIYGALLRKTRASLHQKAFKAARNGLVQMSNALMATHAERAGMLDEAVECFISAGKESFARSAVMEAKQLLERALGQLRDAPRSDKRERLELSALAALGPILTSTEGTKSPAACALYERAVQIARRRPATEQVDWFPIYWGWWYTGADFGIQRERAAMVMSDLSSVDDPEVRLQVQHCIWAIDFNTGRHDTCVKAVDTGLALYEMGSGHESLTLYGGHDPRVCGLGQKGLSLWFKGYPEQALHSVDMALAWAKEIDHVGSISHALDIAAMLNRYRCDYGALRRTTLEMRRLAAEHSLPLLAAKAEIFDGWRMARLGDPAGGRVIAEKGLAIQRQIGTREDFPVYAEMLAQILMGDQEPELALRFLDEAVDETKRTLHLYWLSELYRREAIVKAVLGRDEREIAELVNAALQTAIDQNATALFLKAFKTAFDLGVAARIAERFRDEIRPAMARVEKGGELAPLLNEISDLLSSRKTALP